MKHANSLWKKSTRSTAAGNCVEVRRAEDSVQVRDSKNPNGPILMFAPSAWGTFIADIRSGDYNL